MTSQPEHGRWPSAILVTGGTGDIGRAILQAFRETDPSVTLWFTYAHREALAHHLAETFEATALHLDERDVPRDLTAFPESIDVLVNNAGVNISRLPTAECLDSEWRSTAEVNLMLPFLLIQHFLPGMIAQAKGRIINVNSIYGFRGSLGNAPYTTSKHGLSGLTKTVALEYAHLGITSNEVCPGPVVGDLMNRIAALFNPAAPESYLAAVAEELPMRRLATPSEVANLVVYLASARASYINGASIPVDGGATVA